MSWRGPGQLAVYYDKQCVAAWDEQGGWEEEQDEHTLFRKLWSLQGTVPVYLALLTFPVLNFKSPTIFTKFNVLGKRFG